MPSIVRDWDRRVLTALRRQHPLPPHIEAAGTLLRLPARETDVAAAEQRLGTGLPESYRAFLAVSDGATVAGPDGPVNERPDEGLFAAARIELLVLADPVLLDIYAGITSPDDPLPAPGDVPVEVLNYGPLADSVMIGDGPVLLVPVGEPQEWQVWAFIWEGATAHRSFADYLRAASSQHELPVGPDLDQLAADVRRGAVQRLAELDQRHTDLAATLALELLDEDAVGRIEEHSGPRSDPARARRERDLRVGAVLSKAPHPEALAGLRAALERATSADARMNLVSALIACGAADASALLESAATAADDATRSWAALRLSERVDVTDDRLRQFLTDPADQVRQFALWALVRRDAPNLVTPLLREAQHSASAHHLLAEAVRRQDAAGSIATLRSAADHENVATRRWALAALIDRGDAATFTLLRAAATGDDPTGLHPRWAQAILERTGRGGTAPDLRW